MLVVIPLALLAPAIPAAGAQLRCGSVVNTDITLTSDLTCAGTALRVLAGPSRPIQIDMNGHVLRGNGTGTAVEVDRQLTIHVINGTITGFARAFAVADNNDNGAGLTADHLLLKGNGSWLYWSRQKFNGAIFTNSTIIDSGTGGTHDSSTLTMRNSTLVRSGVAMGSEPNLVLTDNTFVGGGVDTRTNAYIIATGNFFFNCDVGISAPDVFVIPGSKVDHNTFSGCRIGLDLPYPFFGSVAVTNNIFVDNREVGFELNLNPSPGPNETLLVSGNRFLGNGGDGLAITGWPNVTVKGNVALGNGGHGINASHVTDGGGNVARGNQSSPDCVGVVCRAR